MIHPIEGPDRALFRACVVVCLATTLALSTSCSSDPPETPQPCDGLCDPVTEFCLSSENRCVPTNGGTDTGVQDRGRDEGRVDQGRDVGDEPDAGDEDQSEDIDADASDTGDDGGEGDLPPDEPDVDDAGEDLTDAGDVADEPDAEDTTDDGGDTADGADSDTAETDLAEDLLDPLPSAISGLTLKVLLPDRVIVRWLHDGSGDGYRVAFGDGLAQTTGNQARESTIAGLIPGERVSVEVSAFVGDPPRYGLSLRQSILVPEPLALAMRPEHVFLASRSAEMLDGDRGQSQNLNVSLLYEDQQMVPLVINGAKVGGRVAFSVEDGTVAAFDGAVPGELEAIDPGETEVTATYTAGEITLSTTSTVEVVPVYGDTGRIDLHLNGGAAFTEVVRPVTVVVVGSGTPAMPDQIMFQNNAFAGSGNTITLDGLRPGMHRIGVTEPGTGSGVIDIRSHVYLRPDATVDVHRYIYDREGCTLIGRDGGTIVAPDGAELVIEQYSLAGDLEFCFTAIRSDGGPWRGPSSVQPFELGGSYHITPEGEFEADLILRIPVEDELIEWWTTGATEDVLVPTYRTDLGVTEVGPIGVLNESDSVVEVPLEGKGGIISLGGCPVTGPQAGRCRVAFDECVPDVRLWVLGETATCNGQASYSQEVPLHADLDLALTEGGAPDLSGPLETGFGRLLAEAESGPQTFAGCVSNSCLPGDVSCGCQVESAAYLCGHRFDGRVERNVGSGWTDVGTFGLTAVENNSECEAIRTPCAGEEGPCRADLVAECTSACQWDP